VLGCWVSFGFGGCECCGTVVVPVCVLRLFSLGRFLDRQNSPPKLCCEGSICSVRFWDLGFVKKEHKSWHGLGLNDPHM